MLHRPTCDVGTTPRFAPSHTFQELMKKPFAWFSRCAPSPAGARPHPPARALACRRAHVAGLQTSPRCRRELCTSPGCRPCRASRPRTRYKYRHASFAAPKTSSAKSCTKSYATSFTCSSFTCRPRQWPKRAEDVSKTVPGPAASTTGSKSIAGR